MNNTLLLEQRIYEQKLNDSVARFCLDQVKSLHEQIANPPDAWLMSADEPHTQSQVGYLAGLMDLDRADRLEMLSLLLGWMPQWGGDYYPGAVPLEDLDEDKQALYPGPSSKDLRLTRWDTSVLIEFYKNGEGPRLNEILGFESKRAKAEKKRAARAALQAAKTAASAST